MSLLPLFQWMARTSLGIFMRDSTWGFAIIEAVHLLALAILGGTVLILDLRLFGFFMRRRPATLLARETSRYFWASLTVMAISGALLAASEALKCYYNPAFRWKMVILAAAIVFHSTLHSKVARSDSDTVKPIWAPLTAAISLSLWLGVGLAGRAIGLI